MDKRFFLILIVLMLVTIGCVCFVSGNGTETQTTPSDTEETIGTVRRERNQVEHRHGNEDFQQLTGINPLFNGDGLQVTQGGEGLLDFGDNLRLRLFNDSELGGITAKSAPNTPLNARMTLERGGFTGHLTEEGSQAAFTTPGGATITVYGTDFFVVYDEDSGQTVAGNFGGEMEVSAEGTTVQVPAEAFVIAPAGSPPEPPQSPIPFSLAGFEELSREDSPIFALPLLVRTPTPTLSPRLSDTPTPTPIQESIDTPTPTATWDTVPPTVGLLEISPATISIPGDCGTGTTQITVEALDEAGIVDVRAEWVIEQENGQVLMERIDDQTFSAEIGPVSTQGEVSITVIARDTFGNQSKPLQISVDAFICIE
jgi:hypothetical protein